MDRLHQSAGVRQVLEMHGTTHEVICMKCGDITCRHEMQVRPLFSPLRPPWPGLRVLQAPPTSTRPSLPPMRCHADGPHAAGGIFPG